MNSANSSFSKCPDDRTYSYSPTLLAIFGPMKLPLAPLLELFRRECNPLGIVNGDRHKRVLVRSTPRVRCGGVIPSTPVFCTLLSFWCQLIVDIPLNR